MWANLFEEKLASPIAIIIFTIFQCLAPLFQIPNSGADDATLMKAMACSLLSKRKLLPLPLPIICLSCCLIMGSEHNTVLNKILRLDMFLGLDITSNILHKLVLVFLHGQQKMILAVCHHIRPVMAIKIQPLLV